MVNTMIFPPAGVVFAGIVILLLATKDACNSRDQLIDNFYHVERFFRQLEIYSRLH
ncbi:hypothetical protein BGY98DRAFT_1010062 [Russula aff. rugulosa BPL654]|nr:hypothetical protein BGY98DRAFT_1010062 [Russula aff. rugulosa BPL654]